MNDFNSAFLDTALFIYLIEGHSQYGPVVKDILIHCQARSVQLTTSVLTGLEFKTKPLRTNRLDLVQAFDTLTSEVPIQIVSITAEVIENALKLQSQLLSLKAMDAMQLGAAVTYQCDIFITNDKRLSQLKQPQLITLDPWK